MKNKIKKSKSFLFVQTCGSFSDEILVIVGIENKQEIFKYLKKIHAKFDFSKWVLTDFDDWKKSIEEKQKGLFCFNDSISGSVLVLRKYEETWEYYETLMHEIHHVVQKMADKKTFLNEPENQAYLFEFLFHRIRRVLQGLEI